MKDVKNMCKKILFVITLFVFSISCMAGDFDGFDVYAPSTPGFKARSFEEYSAPFRFYQENYEAIQQYQQNMRRINAQYNDRLNSLYKNYNNYMSSGDYERALDYAYAMRNVNYEYKSYFGSFFTNRHDVYMLIRYAKRAMKNR